MEGLGSVPALGAVLAGQGAQLPFFVVNSDGEELREVSAYLRDLMLGDVSPLTCRSYAFDLLRWHRLLWCVGIEWEKATEAEVAAMVGWLRAARNPQRERRQPGSAPAGSVNLKTGKPSLRAGYAPATINHALTVVHGFYSFHGRFRDGPVVNPVPVSAQRRLVLAHRSPLEPVPVVRRARLRQRVPQQAPRSIPDALWDEQLARPCAAGVLRQLGRTGERVARGDPGGRRLGRAAHLRRVQGHQDPPAGPGLPGRVPPPEPLSGRRRASCRRGTGLENPAR